VNLRNHVPLKLGDCWAGPRQTPAALLKETARLNVAKTNFAGGLMCIEPDKSEVLASEYFAQ
jgi:hypothetical protein